MAASRIALPLLHHNDEYRIRQLDKSLGGDGIIDASQFAAKIARIRNTWTPATPGPEEREGKDATQRELGGLVLFSGDAFNPSVESSVSRGEHMIEPLNAQGNDAACVGNHDFDFGYPHLRSLMAKTNFPWHLSNIVDTSSSPAAQTSTSEEPQEGDAVVPGTQRYTVLNVKGVRVGIIGLVEKDWLATLPSLPSEFRYRSMASVAVALSQELRDPEGEACELIVALTHSRVQNDIALANAVGATKGSADGHGVDIVLGGHDHTYYIGRGADSFEGEAFERPGGTDEDQACFIIKSGSDFRDLSEATLSLSPPQHNAIRRRRILSLSVTRHRTLPSDPPLPALRKRIGELLAKVDEATGQPVAFALAPFDTRADRVRMGESACGNFIADVLRHSYEMPLRERDRRGELQPSRSEEGREVDMTLICGGSLRGDSVYGPGPLTLRAVLEVLPFEDATVVLELTGQQIWDALENGFSAYPRQEGRFPQVSGCNVVWDSSKPPGARVVSVTLLRDGHLFGKDAAGQRSAAPQPVTVFEFDSDEQGGCSVEIQRPRLELGRELEMDKTYRVCTREYMFLGHDGFESLKAGKELVDHESGALMSTLLRKYLLGASLLWRLGQLRDSVESGSSSSSAAADAAPAGGANARIMQASVARARRLAGTSCEDAAGEGSLEATTQPTTQTTTQPQSAAMTPSKSKARYIVDSSPSGFQNALHAASAAHHSQHDRVSRHFSNPKKAQEPQDERETQTRRAKLLPSAAAADAADAGNKSPKRRQGDMLEQHLHLSAADVEELRAAGAELALVAPVLDGRIRDVARA